MMRARRETSTFSLESHSRHPTDGDSDRGWMKAHTWKFLAITLILGVFAILVELHLTLPRLGNVVMLNWIPSKSANENDITEPVVKQPGTNKMGLHGKLGLDENGISMWSPSDSYDTSIPMSTLLRNGGGMNIALSNTITLDRTPKDIRSDACRSIVYEDLLPTCVIIIFRNEPFSTLMRSVHSVLNLTPPELLQEIVLVNDGSDFDEMDAIRDYVPYLPKVRLLEHDISKGIVRTRMTAINACQASTFIILDSHVEVSEGWALPLLSRLKQQPNAVILPQVFGVDAETFEYSPWGIATRMGFIWSLMEHCYDSWQEEQLKHRVIENDTDFYFESALMSGGLFASNKQFFLDIGAYDLEFKSWGTENLEFSFRTWMCGGRIEISKCSHTYHIFRKGGRSYSVPYSDLLENKIRTMIWMDQFSIISWKMLSPSHYNIDVESLKERQAWREEKGCKSFKWFLNTVYPESYIRTLDDIPYLGTIKAELDHDYCLQLNSSIMERSRLILAPCDSAFGSFMYFKRILAWTPLQNDEFCVKNDLSVGWCQASYEHERQWSYVDGRLKINNECLTIGPLENGLTLLMSACSEDSSNQKWIWDTFNVSDDLTVFDLLQQNS